MVYHITLIVLVIGKAQFRRAMLSCDSSCLPLLCGTVHCILLLMTARILFYFQLPRRRITHFKRSQNGGTHHHFSRTSVKTAASKMWRRLTQKRKGRRKSADEPRNSVSKIDKASRVMFPLVFVMLNIIYCLVYYY